MIDQLKDQIYIILKDCKTKEQIFNKSFKISEIVSEVAGRAMADLEGESKMKFEDIIEKLVKEKPVAKTIQEVIVEDVNQQLRMV